MKLLKVYALMIWLLSLLSQSESFFTEVIDSLPSPGTQEQVEHNSRRNKQTRSISRDNHVVRKRPFFIYPPVSIRSHDCVSVNSDPEDDSSKCTLETDIANCSVQHLYWIPQNLPTDIRVLDLHHNCLYTLNNYTFARYSGLEYLNLSVNLVWSVHVDAFYNLSMLRELNLFSNDLHYGRSEIFPINVFCPLTSLTCLDISHNHNDDSRPLNMKYPDIALSCLRNLESLTVDIIPMNDSSSPFGDGFKNLKKLTSLAMYGDSFEWYDIYSLHSDSFSNLETLEDLTIQDGPINGYDISGNPFHNLKRLRKLDLSGNSNIGFQYLEPIFDGLYHLEHLIELNIGSIVEQFSLSQCLDVSILKKFPKHLTTLKAVENNLEAVDENVIALLPENLTTLDLSGNRFTFGGYLYEIYKLGHLTSLSLNGYNSRHGFPIGLRPQKPATHNCTTNFNTIISMSLKLPPKLITIEMNNAGLNFDWKKLEINTTNSLTHLSVSENHFRTLEGPIKGLHSLKYLDLSMCGVQEIGSQFFSGFFSLEVLRLDSNALGDCLSNPKSQKVFHSLTNLKSLNLTNNAVTSLSPEIFKTLTNLSCLYLRKNFLVSFDVDLRGILALSSLDLSYTQLFTLSEETQAYFDNLVKNDRVNVSIYMESTPISCKCPNLKFLQWMTTSPAFPKPFQNYYCDIVYFKSPAIEDNYEETITILRKQCASKAVLLFLVVSSTLALSSLIIGGIVYRFRWNIRYLYYAVYLRFKQDSNAPETTREYDAFICYASEDADFAEGTVDRELSGRGLRTFLHGRDFRAGDYVSSNIVNAVCSSKKTVVFLTEALLESYWCGYEIEMAKLEGIHTGRPVLIFVFLEDIPKNKLSRDLLYNIKNNTYMEYTSSALDPDQMRMWWDKLANDIRD